jgi:hypothetical protein
MPDMPWTIRFHAGERIIETEYTGTINPCELEQSIRETLAASAAHGCARFLVDGTAMLGGHTPVDLHTNMELAIKFPFPEPFHEALVLPPKAPTEMVKNMEFWAAGLRLRGFDVQIFIERAPARNWLRAR